MRGRFAPRWLCCLQATSDRSPFVRRFFVRSAEAQQRGATTVFLIHWLLVRVQDGPPEAADRAFRSAINGSDGLRARHLRASRNPCTVARSMNDYPQVWEEPALGLKRSAAFPSPFYPPDFVGIRQTWEGLVGKVLALHTARGLPARFLTACRRVAAHLLRERACRARPIHPCDVRRAQTTCGPAGTLLAADSSLAFQRRAA